MTRANADSPAVSCVLIFLDGARYIDDAIRSVVGQTGFDDWELILVDDGSTDDSTAMAKAWAMTDPGRIRYIDHPGHQNRGMSASRNLGVSAAEGAYIGFLDCDDVWLPSALAHRMRVAAAHPMASVVVGGTWRWHSWTGDEADLALDRRMTLPVAPPHTTLVPPRLFSSMYGIPGGGYVPAMCSVLIRREALLALGGMESDFRGLYEDQVLYVKAGLKLSAVVDPRPLALYRQHPASACSVSIANGEWSREGPSDPATRFFTWLKGYVGGEAGPRSAERKIVQRNIAYFLRTPDQRARAPRELLRRYTPQQVRAFVRWWRRRGDDARRDAPPSVMAEWSAQFLAVVASPMSGTVLVVAPKNPTGEPWTSAIPDDAFGSQAVLTRQPLDDVGAATDFRHVVVPFGSSVEMSTGTLLAALQRLLRPKGTAAALIPGRAWVRPADQVAAVAIVHEETADEVAKLAREYFPGKCISVETFGNSVTARAVAAGLPATEVRGVAIDNHDAQTQVLLALVISEPKTASPAVALEDPP